MSSALPNAKPSRAPAMLRDLEKVCTTRRLGYFAMSGTQLSAPKST